MPAARYWRLAAVEPYSLSGSLVISELALFAAGVRQPAPNTASISPSGGTLAALDDSNTATTATWSNWSGLTFDWDLGSAVDVDEIQFGSGPTQGVSVFGCLVFYSTDSTTWSEGLPLRGITWPGANAIRSVTGGFELDSSTRVLLNGEAANNSLTIVDQSIYAWDTTVWNQGNGLKNSTTQKKYGNGSYWIDNNIARLNIAASVARGEIVTTDFTLEGWYYPTASPTTDVQLWANTLTLFYLFYDSSRVLRVRAGSGAANELSSGASLVPINAWFHVAYVRQDTTMRLFLDGVLVDSKVGTPYNNGDLFVFMFNPNHFLGYADNLRVSSTARYTANFTPVEHKGLTGVGGSRNAFAVPTFSSTPQLASPYEPPAFAAKWDAPRPLRNHRRDFEGWGRIIGTTKEKALPSNTPLRRQVFCMDMVTGNIVDAMWSDATTGNYVFNDLDLTRKYTVFSYDHTNAYRAVIADNLTPELMT